MHNPIVDKLRAVIQPPVEGAGYELVDVEWKHEGGGWVMRVFIDGPGGISHSDCERVSRDLSAALDVHDVIPHAYSLEVSSPGLDRPLVTAAHFQRFAGQRAHLRFFHGVDGRRNFTGRIVKAEGDAVTVEVDGKERALPLADLEKANLVYEPEDKPRPGAARSRKR